MPASVRYVVNDVGAAISFYTEMLNFRIELHPAAAFAIRDYPGYETDLTDAKWALCTSRTHAVDRRAWPLREIVKVILHVLCNCVATCRPHHRVSLVCSLV